MSNLFLLQTAQNSISIRKNSRQLRSHRSNKKKKEERYVKTICKRLLSRKSVRRGGTKGTVAHLKTTARIMCPH